MIGVKTKKMITSTFKWSEYKVIRGMFGKGLEKNE
jgi:hypothetical protein